jgi:hypothetical protein
MATCFGLMALWLAVLERPLLAGLAFLAAFHCKESAYPLVLLPPILTLLGARNLRKALLAGLPGAIALVASLYLKHDLLGIVVPPWTTIEIPLLTRVQGWSTYAGPLLLWPMSSAADNDTGAFLGAAFTGVLIFGPLLPFTRHLVRGSRLAEIQSKASAKLPTLVFFGVGFLATLALTGGVPVRPDFGGGRLWLLPAAMAIGGLAYAARPIPLWIALVPGLLLLQLNLLPYREASRRMATVVDRVTAELEDPEAAVRVTNLEKQHGPVPLFFLMTENFNIAVGGPECDRVLLTRDDQERDREAVAALDATWRQRMRDKKLLIVELLYRNGTLVPRRPN